jgi:hypothetical protein
MAGRSAYSYGSLKETIKARRAAIFGASVRSAPWFACVRVVNISASVDPISLSSYGLRLLVRLRFSPPPRPKHLLPYLLHHLQPFRGNAGEFGDGVAAGLVVKDQAVADQAQRFHGMRGVAEGLLDVEQKRGQV